MIPKELIIIILGALCCGVMMYRDDYKLKKERDKYDREKHLSKS